MENKDSYNEQQSLMANIKEYDTKRLMSLKNSSLICSILLIPLFALQLFGLIKQHETVQDDTGILLLISAVFIGMVNNYCHSRYWLRRLDACSTPRQLLENHDRIIKSEFLVPVILAVILLPLYTVLTHADFVVMIVTLAIVVGVCALIYFFRRCDWRKVGVRRLRELVEQEK